jgi:hypothetical protein
MVYHCSDALGNASDDDGALPRSVITQNATLPSTIGRVTHHLLIRLDRPGSMHHIIRYDELPRFALPGTVSAADDSGPL